MNWNLIKKQLKAGDNNALEIFYQKFGGYCTQKLIRNHQCTREDAMDVFVEAIIRLREKLIKDDIEEVKHLKSYLFTICRNIFLNQQRDHNNRMSRFESYYYGSQFLTADHNESYEALMSITQKAWKTLSERCKDVLFHFYVDKMNMQEISELVGAANANVAKTTKSRCLKQLMEKANEFKKKFQKGHLIP